ncbi:hypothetical protein VNO77_25034 [Canavalia gladiata]|uniref:Uncharacterized protein n=1 Tax=Canavalia gladiata TaxID=3824 RepID=A0AAN9QAJ0_CANGL
MPTKQVTYRNDKAVVVRVYVEKPRKKRSTSIQQHRHHHHLHYHIRHTVRQEVVHASTSKGFDRKAWLLMYSHLLRESTRGASPTPLLSKWCPNNNLQPPPQIALSNKKRAECAGKVACFGSWKLLIPSFLRSFSKAQKSEKNKKQVHGGFSGNRIKILQVRTGKSFIPNLFSKTRKSA